MTVLFTYAVIYDAAGCDLCHDWEPSEEDWENEENMVPPCGGHVIWSGRL